MGSTRSIRFRISTLLVIPLVSLVALWVFAAVVTTSPSAGLLTVSTLYEKVGDPGDRLAAALEREHLLSAEFLTTRSSGAHTRLEAQRLLADRERARFRSLSGSQEARDAMTPAVMARFNDVSAAVDGLDDTRADVDAGTVDLVALGQRFAWLPTTLQQLIDTMTLSDDVPLYQQSRSLTMVGFARDVLSREVAMAAGVLAARRTFTAAERLAFTRLAATREYLFEQGMAELEPSLRAPFERLLVSGPYRMFETIESWILAGKEGPRATHALLRQVTDELTADYQDAVSQGGVALASRAEPTAVATFVRAGVAGLLGLLAVGLTLLVSLRTGGRIARELSGLRTAARELAEVRLPAVVERLRQGEKVDVAATAPALGPPGRTAEVRELAAAFSAVQRTAVEAAVDQARIRESAGQALRNLARRSQGLLQRQLRLLDAMQRTAEDPAALEGLFRLDHMTTRMRRHAEGLIVLSGGSAGRIRREPVPVADVLQGAIGEVEDYTRVRLHEMQDVAVRGAAVADIVHLFAELIENAAAYSPPTTEISVRGEAAARGFAVEVEDRGLGIRPDDRESINRRLAGPPEFDLADTDRLGLVVVGRLAARHGVRVELRSSPYGGTTAIVLLPHDLLDAPAGGLPPAAFPLPEGADA
ncbi:nitrate- and nitrite sensing domain-containing protein [Microbispora sp. NPDC049125]|uniref:sensor histidine kinase n=1 Tax=Microbispora sp. NPDC049125 TaxID=3154929 RepID=UPI0034672A3A